MSMFAACLSNRITLASVVSPNPGVDYRSWMWASPWDIGFGMTWNRSGSRAANPHLGVRNLMVRKRFAAALLRRKSPEQRLCRFWY